MYYGNRVDGSAVMKRRSTRHISEITAIGSEYGNSAKIIVPRSWLRKRVIAFLHSDYISKHPEERNK
jgi:hypothetical protein